MHHHGIDGSCHSGPGGMFGCAQCDSDIEKMHQTLLDHQEKELRGPGNIPVTLLDSEPDSGPEWEWPEGN